MKDEKLSFAGEVSIDEVTIITAKGFYQTVTTQVIGIEIYEDLFGSFITGQVILKESHDLLNLFPLIGQEFIKIELRTPTLPDDMAFKGEFFIYRMAERVKVAGRETAYALSFMSKEALIDMNKKVSKTYKGKISDTVQAILTAEDGLETTKQVNVEETSNATKHTSNFWSPLKNINYLANQAINAKLSPSYTFFENTNGLNFISLNSMIGMPVYQMFTWDQYSNEINPMGSSNKDLNKDYQRIIEFHTPETFDYINRITSGMFASRMQHHDLVTKKFTDKNYFALTNRDKTDHLNKTSVITDNHISKPNSMLIHEHKYYGNFNGFGDVTNTKTLQERISTIQQFNSFKLEIIVPGRLDYCVGQKINLRVFKQQELHAMDNPEDYLDKIYSGDYLIGALSHSINVAEHRTTMELIKESYIMEL